MNQQSGVASEPTPIAGKARHDRYCRRGDERFAQEPHVPAVNLAKQVDFLGPSPSYFGISDELNTSTTNRPGTSNTGRTWLRNAAAAASSIDPESLTVG